MRRLFTIIFGFFICLHPAYSWTHGSGNFLSVAKVGGGGWLVGADITSGQYIVRTDTYGAYIFNQGNQTWSQIVTQSSMPAANFGFFPTTGTSQVSQDGGGVVEITACPSNTAIIYMFYGPAASGTIFKSTDRAAHWVATNFTPVAVSPNGGIRFDGRKMMVDPINCNVVYVGTDSSGLWRTFDGGATWATLSPGTIATSINNYNMVIDPDVASGSAVCPGGVGNCSNKLYILSNGVQTYTSTNAGATWSQTVGGPISVEHMAIAATGGIVWTAGSIGQAGGAIWRLKAGTWTNIGGAAYHAIAVDPANPDHVVAQDGASQSGQLITSVNGTGASPTFSAAQSFTRSAIDVPWLGWANEFFMSSGDIQFDSTGSNLLIFSEGIGVWKTNPPNSGSFVWTSMTSGIEQLVTNSAAAPFGYLLPGFQDRANFTLTSPNSYPSAQTNPDYNNSSVNVQNYGYDYVPGNSLFLVNLANNYQALNRNYPSTSVDGGQTYKPFNSYYQDLPGSSLSSYAGGACGAAGQLQFTVSTTVGLTTWVPSTSVITGIVHLVQYNPTPNVTNGGLGPGFIYVCVVDATHFVAQALTFSASYQQGRTLLYVDTNPYVNWAGGFAVVNITNNAGAIHVQVVNTSSATTNGFPVCISGVNGTTEANGCWQTTNASGNTFDLAGSTFTNAYVSGGDVKYGLQKSSGSIASSSTTSIAMVPSDGGMPLCTTNGGITWVEYGTAVFVAKIDNGSGSAGTVLTVSSIAGGNSIHVGDTLTAIGGGSIIASTTITGLGTGIGGVGTYTVNNSQLVSSENMSSLFYPGWSGAHFFWQQHTIAADRVTPNTFYLYGAGSPVGTGAGFWKMTNCGVPTQTSSFFLPSSGGNTVMRTIPGNAGHLFISAGSQGSAGSNHPGGNQFYRSTDAAVTFTGLPGLREVLTLDAGPVASGGYPVIYLSGWNDPFGTGLWNYGNYRSVNANAPIASFTGTINATDLNVTVLASGTMAVGQSIYGANMTAAATIIADAGGGGGTGHYTISATQSAASGSMTAGPTWNLITQYPLGSMDTVTAIAADGIDWHKFYICFGGSGCMQGRQNFLLNRDINPANDNFPVFLNKAA